MTIQTLFLKNAMNETRNLIQECLKIIDSMKINTESRAGPNTKKLKENSIQLSDSIASKYPYISIILNNAVDKLVSKQNERINAFFFGEIRAYVKILDSLTKTNGKKIFISHSSKNKEIIEDFIDFILQLGIGIKAKDIFCSSIEDMNIRNGEDIRTHIHTNIKTADFSFLMISRDYKRSEICINEMGAVWAYDANVRLFLLPDTNFATIGWLCDVKKADKINSPVALDKIKDELVDYYSLTLDSSSWSRQREKFLIKYSR